MPNHKTFGEAELLGIKRQEWELNKRADTLASDAAKLRAVPDDLIAASRKAIAAKLHIMLARSHHRRRMADGEFSDMHKKAANEAKKAKKDAEGANDGDTAIRVDGLLPEDVGEVLDV